MKWMMSAKVMFGSDVLKSLLPVLLIGIVVATLVVVTRIVLGLGKGKIEMTYEREETLFTPAERSFLGVLELVAGDAYRVFGKVRLADLMHVKKGGDRASWQAAFNRISCKHLDFVVCEAETLEILFAIELDDGSHASPKRQKRDQFVDKACGAAGLALARVPAKRVYTRQDIHNAIAVVGPRLEEQGRWK